MLILKQITEAVVKIESEETVRELVKKAINEKCKFEDILENGLVAGINIVGEKWKNGEAFIPEVLLAANAVRAGTDLLKEGMVNCAIKPVGKIVIGTVKDDVHNIGKALVGMTLESCGFEVYDLGIDVSPEKFVDAVKSHNPDILCMSALLTTTMLQMSNTLEALRKEGLKISTLVGGAPVTQDYADSIGASGYASDATSAVAKAKELLKLSK